MKFEIIVYLVMGISLACIVRGLIQFREIRQLPTHSDDSIEALFGFIQAGIKHLLGRYLWFIGFSAVAFLVLESMYIYIIEPETFVETACVLVLAFIGGLVFSGVLSWWITSLSLGRVSAIISLSKDDLFDAISKIGNAITLLLFGSVLLGMSGLALYAQDFIKTTPTHAEAVVFLHGLFAICLGIAINALVVRLGGGMMAKSADIATQLTACIEFDLPENTLKNPAEMADLIGDHVCKVWARSIEWILVVVLVIVMLWCAIFRLPEDALTQIGMRCLLFPFEIMSIAVIALFFNIRSGFFRYPLFIVFAGLLYVSDVIGFYDIQVVIPGILFTAVTVGLVQYVFKKQVASTKSAAYSGVFSVILRGGTQGLLSSIFFSLMFFAALLLCVKIFDHAGAVNSGVFSTLIFGSVMFTTMARYFPDTFTHNLADNVLAWRQQIAPDTADDEVSHQLRTTMASTNQSIYLNHIFTCFVGFLASIGLFYGYILELDVSASNHIEGNLGDFLTQSAFGAMVSVFGVVATNYLFLFGVVVGVASVIFILALILKQLEKNVAVLVEEIRRQLTEKEGIWDGSELPDYFGAFEKVVRTSFHPLTGLLIFLLILPFAVSLCLGVAGWVGALVGLIVTSFFVSIAAGTIGTLWTNAKLDIRNLGSSVRSEPEYISATVADMMSDALRDVVSPILLPITITIILISLLSVRFAIHLPFQLF